MKVANILKWVSVLAAGGFGWDVAEMVDGGTLDNLPALIGNVLGLLGFGGTAVAMNMESVQKALTFGRQMYAKYNESDLPNGCNAEMNWIVSGLKRGVPPEALKPRFDAQWQVIVGHVAPKKAEASHAA